MRLKRFKTIAEIEIFMMVTENADKYDLFSEFSPNKSSIRLENFLSFYF